MLSPFLIPAFLACIHLFTHLSIFTQTKSGTKYCWAIPVFVFPHLKRSMVKIPDLCFAFGTQCRGCSLSNTIEVDHLSFLSRVHLLVPLITKDSAITQKNNPRNPMDESS